MTLNPFDLRGPEFLAFFILFSAAVVIVADGLRKRREAREPSTFNLAQDPYQVAYLQGGTIHLVQSAVLSLLDRKLLKARDSHLRTTDPKSIELVRRPLEKAILQRFLTEGKVLSLFSDTIINEKAEDIGDGLRGMKLIPDEKQKLYRLSLFLMGLILVWAVAGNKIYVALSRGHHNILFLIILSFLFPFVLWKILNRRRTSAGDKALASLKDMFAGLYTRRHHLRLHSETNELIPLACLFGLSALPAMAEEMISPLHLRPARDSAFGSGCGTGCGHSSSSGGSCGGGCGGGCGGCGG